MGYYSKRFWDDESGDADALAFITAAGLIDAAQISAINTLVADLKAAGLWDKMKAIYPFIGGTAESHKWNLKDPRDLDVAFRIVWNGTVTHNSNGITGNGTDGYGDTKCSQSVNVSLNSEHISCYIRTNLDGLYGDIGTRNQSNTALGTSIIARFSNLYYTRNQSQTPSTSSNINSQGFYINSRLLSNSYIRQKNSTQNIANASSISIQNYSYYILGLNNQNALLYASINNVSFATIGLGLDATESINLYNLIQAYQTTLNRQV